MFLTSITSDIPLCVYKLVNVPDFVFSILVFKVSMGACVRACVRVCAAEKELGLMEGFRL